MAVKLPTNNTFEDFLQSPRGDRQLRLNISRNTLIAFVISLLIHALILFFVIPKFQREQKKELPPFEVVLAQPEQKIEIPPPQEPIPEPLPEPIKKQKVMTQKPTKAPKPSAFKVPDVLATTKPASEPAPKIETKSKETDMFAALNAKRAERDRTESSAEKINAEAAAREIGPSEEQKRDAKIKSNFQNGTNGIFEITSLGSRSATFTFLGWLNDYNSSKRQFFEVEASTGQDVRLVMIRRMIGLIREHYDGDFNWESQRLGRVIVMSARPEDSAGLEDFMMTEFFGQNYKTAL